MRTDASDTDHLRKDAVERAGMDERHEVPSQPDARLEVDHVDPLRGEIVDRRGDVPDAEADVVHPRSTPGEEPTNGRVLAERRHQLDPTAPEPEVDRLDALVVE